MDINLDSNTSVTEEYSVNGLILDYDNSVSPLNLQLFQTIGYLSKDNKFVNYTWSYNNIQKYDKVTIDYTFNSSVILTLNTNYTEAAENGVFNQWASSNNTYTLDITQIFLKSIYFGIDTSIFDQLDQLYSITGLKNTISEIVSKVTINFFSSGINILNFSPQYFNSSEFRYSDFVNTYKMGVSNNNVDFYPIKLTGITLELGSWAQGIDYTISHTSTYGKKDDNLRKDMKCTSEGFTPNNWHYCNYPSLDPNSKENAKTQILKFQPSGRGGFWKRMCMIGFSLQTILLNIKHELNKTFNNSSDYYGEYPYQVNSLYYNDNGTKYILIDQNGNIDSHLEDIIRDDIFPSIYNLVLDVTYYLPAPSIFTDANIPSIFWNYYKKGFVTDSNSINNYLTAYFFAYRTSGCIDDLDATDSNIAKGSVPLQIGTNYQYSNKSQQLSVNVLIDLFNEWLNYNYDGINSNAITDLYDSYVYNFTLPIPSYTVSACVQYANRDSKYHNFLIGTVNNTSTNTTTQIPPGSVYIPTPTSDPLAYFGNLTCFLSVARTDERPDTLKYFKLMQITAGCSAEACQNLVVYVPGEDTTNTDIKQVISGSCKASISIPNNLIGKKGDTGIAILKSIGLIGVTGTCTDTDNIDSDNNIVSINPAAGTIVPLDSQITLGIYCYKETYKVPNVVNSTYNTAVSTLNGQGWNNITKDDTTTTADNSLVDNVYQQDPVAGTEQSDKSITIKLYIYKQAPPVPVYTPVSPPTYSPTYGPKYNPPTYTPVYTPVYKPLIGSIPNFIYSDGNKYTYESAVNILNNLGFKGATGVVLGNEDGANADNNNYIGEEFYYDINDNRIDVTNTTILKPGSTVFLSVYSYDQQKSNINKILIISFSVIVLVILFWVLLKPRGSSTNNLSNNNISSDFFPA